MLFCAGNVSAADEAIFVNGSSGLDTNDGYSWNTAKLTIQNATGTVNSNGVVTIADGVYSGTGNTNITIDRNMTIQGQSQTGTIINGTGTNWIFSITAGANVTLKNLTITNATAETFGAINNNGNLTVENCTFTHNRETSDLEMSYGGGAIRNSADYGTILINLTDCTFEYNHAGRSGAAVLNYCGVAGNYVISTVTNCTFNNNTANTHAIFYNVAFSGDIISEVTNCTFTNNTVGSGGGAVANFASYSSVKSTITDCDFINNHAGFGGAIYSYANFQVNFITCNVTNCNFINNTASQGGAIAIARYSGILNLTAHFNRIVGNTATGSAIFNIGGNVNATGNWWGSNADPSGQIVGQVDYSPWLFMTINATPETINNTQTSLITVSFNNYSLDGSSSSPLDPNLGHIPDGAPVTFSLIGNILGSLAEPFTAETINGTAAIFFTAGSAGIQQINASTDNQNVSAYVTIIPASFVEVSKDFRDLPWGSVITTAYYNDQIYAIVKLHNSGPDSTSSVSVLDLLDGLTWTGNYYVYRTVGSYPNTESAWVFNDPEYTFNGTHWNAGDLSTAIGSSRWLAIEVIVNQTGTVSNYAETLTHSTSPYQGYANYTAYLTADITPTIVTVDDIRGNKSDTVTLKAVLTDYLGNALTGETVEFWIDGAKVGENTTDSTGTALFIYVISQTPGNHTLLAVFNETGFYQGSNATGELYVPTADLYIQITSDKNNPTVGETFTLRYKLGNNGPDDATNVTITIPLPEGFVISKIEGDGNWTVTGNTITWTMTNVTVGDPNLYITGWTTRPGNYLFTASIASDTFSINSMGISPLTLNAQPTVNAATTTNTVGMQTTGTPAWPLALAVFSVLCGLIATRKKQ